METLREAILRLEPCIDLLHDCLGFGRFAEVTVTSDGFFLARDRGDIGFNRFLGAPSPAAMERTRILFARLDERHQMEVICTLQGHGISPTKLGIPRPNHKEKPMDKPFDDLFGEPISVYTDTQALEDGVLVAITGEGGVNRVTRAVFDHFAKPTGETALGECDISQLLAAITAMRAIVPQDGWHTGTYQGKALWLIPNEIGGLTLVFPEDY